MARRGGTHQVRCKEESGCREFALISYGSQRELRETLDQSFYKNYKCTRHRNPERVLGPENTAVQAVLIATDHWLPPMREGAEPRYVGRFWYPEGKTTGSGFNHSEAHKAYADDFPAGTRLVITAYVETPEVQALMAQEDSL